MHLNLLVNLEITPTFIYFLKLTGLRSQFHSTYELSVDNATPLKIRSDYELIYFD